MKPLRSIRWRLQVWYGLLIAALLTGFGVTAYHFEHALVIARIDEELERAAFGFNDTVRPRGGKKGGGDNRKGGMRPVRQGDEEDRKRDRNGDGFINSGGRDDDTRVEGSAVATIAALDPKFVARGLYSAVWTKNRAPFTASANAPDGIPKPSNNDGLRTFRWRGTYREIYIVGNPDDIVMVGRDVAQELAAVRGFGWRLAGAGVGLLGITLLMGGLLVTRALRPIRDISGTAQKIATGDLTQRISARDTGSELGQLTTVLNTTFSRLEASFAQQARFTADAAHELRTPLTVMLTHAQNGLASDGLTAEQREAFEACQRAAQRMRRLIDALLELSRLDAGQETMRMGDLNLNAVAAECLELVRPLAKAKHIKLHSDLGDAECRGDVLRLEQVVTNLLTNAIHYGHDRGEVRVTTGREGGEVYVTVADNGPGIGPEHLPRIFDRFYRVDKARSATGRTGLGLAISHAIIDAHGGSIQVTSTPGEGATFTVRLPAR